jgi:polyisoprenoid-binding protein YceI
MRKAMVSAIEQSRLPSLDVGNSNRIEGLRQIKMKKRFLPLLAALTLVLGTVLARSASAQHEVLSVSPNASSINFTLGGSAHTTEGTFHVQRGSVEFDPKAAIISGLVVVSAGSGKTGNDARDKKMWEQVLDVPHFADITFAPKSYQGMIATSGDSRIQVTGVFTLHGEGHEITVPMQLHFDGGTCTAKTHFVVPYVKWGLKDPSIFILKVAKEVEVDLSLTGQLSH